MERTTKQFTEDERITARVERIDSNPNMSDMPAGSRHFKVTLRYRSKRLTVPFSQGPAIQGEPSADDVLDCLASDAAGFENGRSFEDWASEYGYDTDSRKAEKTYKAVERQSRKLLAFLGQARFEELLYNTARL